MIEISQKQQKILALFPSEIFTSIELTALESATDEYRERTADVPTAIQKKRIGTAHHRTFMEVVQD